MYSKVNYGIVGFFVLLFGAGMIWFFFWLGKYGMHREFDTYKLVMTQSITGLSKDSVVKLRGVDIGRVSEIRINPTNIEEIEVYLKIKKDVPIKKNMEAHTQLMGVTGLLSIEIDGGTNDAETLHPTDVFIPVIPTSPSWFEKTTKGIGSMSEQLVEMLKKSQKLLNDENIKNVSKILDNTKVLTKKGSDVSDKAIESFKEVDLTMKEFRSSFAQLNKKLDKAITDFGSMKRDFSAIKNVSVPTINKLMQTSKNFNRVTLKFEKSLDRGDYNAKKIFEPMIVDMGILSDQISDMTKKFSDSPSDMFFKSRKTRKGPGE